MRSRKAMSSIFRCSCSTSGLNAGVDRRSAASTLRGTCVLGDARTAAAGGGPSAAAASCAAARTAAAAARSGGCG
jgi:hypothetical protein